MNKPKDEKIQKFLEETRLLGEEKFTIVQKLREIIFSNIGKAEERMMYGGILFSLKEDFGGIFVYKKHVSLEFSNGFKMKDPKRLLEGKGKFRRHLKFETITDIKNKDVNYFVKQTT